MGSAAKIVAQGVPQQVISFPGWKLPTRIKLRATVGGGAGAPTAVAADTTDGLTITQGTAGIYTVLFPACRAIATPVIVLAPALAATFAQWRLLVIDTLLTISAQAAPSQSGAIVFHAQTVAGAATAPVDGSQIFVEFWADLG